MPDIGVDGICLGGWISVSADGSKEAGEPIGESSGGQPNHALWDVTTEEVPEHRSGSLVAAVVEARCRLTAAWRSVGEADRELQAALEAARAGGVSVPQLVAILGGSSARAYQILRRGSLSAGPEGAHSQHEARPPGAGRAPRHAQGSK